MGTSTIAAALILAMTTGAAAFAQPAMPPPEPWGGWSVAAGYETFAWRDISRNRRPPDASPVSWRGDGPVVTARYAKRRERSAHIGDVTIASAGSAGIWRIASISTGTPRQPTSSS